MLTFNRENGRILTINHDPKLITHPSIAPKKPLHRADLHRPTQSTLRPRITIRTGP